MNDDQVKEAEGYIRKIIELIGDDPRRQGLLETPARVVRSWAELYGGYSKDIQDHVKIFEQKFDQIVVLRNVDFYSMCEHHMLPFFGKLSVAYLPRGDKVIGVSKLARIVEIYSRRLQIQERLTSQIAEAIEEAVDPEGVAVVVDAVHLCMASRGVKQQHASMRTSKMTGCFRDDFSARQEVLSLLMGI